MLRIDRNGLVVDAGAAELELLRRIRSEVLGVDVRALTHPQDLAATTAAHGRDSADYLKRYVLPDGRFVLARCVAKWVGDYGEARLIPVDPGQLARPTEGDAVASMLALLERRRMVERMRHKVTVNKPRRGRDRGEWRLRIRRPDGSSTHELSGIPCEPGTKGLADALAVDREAQLNGERMPGRQTVGDVLEAYASWSAKHQSKGTAKFTAKAIRWARLSGLADVYADEVARRDLAEARDALWAGVKGNTAAGYWRRWRLAWAWALEREMVDRELPTMRAKRLGPGDRTQKRAMTDHEVVDLLTFASEYAGGRWLTLLWALAETGARIGELGAVDCADVTREGRIRLRETKTGAHRTVYVSPPLAGRIWADHVQGRSSGPVWTAPRGGKVNHGSVGPLMQKWRTERGLMGEVDTHSLRRYAVARLERAGVAQAAGRAVTGHSSAAIYAAYADRGRYDVLAACSALWLPSGHLSTGVVTMVEQRPAGETTSVHSRESVYSPSFVAAKQLTPGSVHACPRLRSLLRGLNPGLDVARRSLIQSLEVPMPPP